MEKEQCFYIDDRQKTLDKRPNKPYLAKIERCLDSNSQDRSVRRRSIGDSPNSISKPKSNCQTPQAHQHLR